ncbi:MAG: ATP-binding cassette domain-containing protein [Pseudomonadales bacterium]|nr:ABC transporter ATP-binding protein [Pseudomonadales bacterium]NIX08979.1 ATP-binding cassette domain-containing protein [Pseudomonadales bacterium]
MSPVLTVAGLAKRYVDGDAERRVLDEVSFELGAGEILAVVGPSGSGKSTLLNVVAGLVLPDAGRVELTTPEGTLRIDELDDAARGYLRRRRLGYVFQFFNLVPTLTVLENVLLPLELTGRSDLQAPAMQRLADLGMEDRLDEIPDNLSGGERQRTAIARALAHEPLLVLADEPTGNLDGDNANLVIELLWREVRAQGAAMLVATHNEAIAARADHVLRLGAGAA